MRFYICQLVELIPILFSAISFEDTFRSISSNKAKFGVHFVNAGVCADTYKFS